MGGCTDVMRRRCCPWPLAALRSPKVVGVAEHGTSPVVLEHKEEMKAACKTWRNSHSLGQKKKPSAEVAAVTGSLKLPAKPTTWECPVGRSRRQRPHAHKLTCCYHCGTDLPARGKLLQGQKNTAPSTGQQAIY